jgi:hypothetical protein
MSLTRTNAYASPAIRAADAAFDAAQTLAFVNHFTLGCSFKWHKCAEPLKTSLRPRIRGGCGDDSPTLRSKGDEGGHMLQINLFGEPPTHATKWTIVVDSPQELRRLMLFDTQAEVHAEIIRLRERGVAHVFALAPVAACGDRLAVAAAVVGTPDTDSMT